MELLRYVMLYGLIAALMGYRVVGMYRAKITINKYKEYLYSMKRDRWYRENIMHIMRENKREFEKHGKWFLWMSVTFFIYAVLIKMCSH